MAANPEVYTQHMEAGHNAAWDQDWSRAIAAYTAALKENPEDLEAHLHLGLSLLKDNQLERAFKVYNRATQLSPDDPIALEKSADVLERMGRLKEAAQQYVKVSDVYLAQQDLDKAIGNWERATQLTPGLVGVHAKLARAYERIGDKKSAIREYLTLAYNFRRIDQADKAIKAVERALRLDKRNVHALNALRALKAGGEVVLPDWEKEKAATKKPSQDSGFDPFGLDDDVVAIAEADPKGPLGEAMTSALMLLAAFVVESGTLDAFGGDALQGMEMQRQGLIEQAIEAYQRAEKGLRHPALKLSLGGLLLEKNKADEAAKHLGEAVTDPQLAAGAMHGLGQAYFKMGEQKKATRYLVKSLQAVETTLAVEADEAEELTNTYDRLVTALDGRNEQALAAVNERFVGLLSGKDWKQRIAETRRHLEEIMPREGDQAAFELLVDASSDVLAESIGHIDRYIRQGLYILAMDEAHRAIETSPYYLPIHVRMAEIMMNEGRVRQAINKYNTVARSYLVRDEKGRAASILTEVLEMAPLDVEVRISLIELLEGEERWLEALDQYIDLANTYRQLGNFDQARDTYIAAERLGKKHAVSTEKIVSIKHQIADLDQMRLQMRKAQKIYEEIIEIAADDEKALRMLVDLYYNQGNQVEAIKRLDVLLGIYAKRGLSNKITQVLEELVKHYPNDTGLRSRLAKIYVRLSRTADAIEQMDALGELQLEAGLHKDAADTIRQIIALKPEQVEDYERLLSQLGG